ncbi:ABC transporter substrate-binding protein [Helicobacter pylori]|uniref:ABC transporter substrate-binding protein n=1 Tax=Helicobacter pylori TaxID=210 RepID=UPI00073D22CB|nr:ABC transporter substrate-binding protein [Helicobacter pylori]OKA01917.1 iron ABC transporter substrate-binding protein [Helicobacter pylori]OKA02742.1 iron ABC transporter substrate-binding protein [Helicobacter pylori]OMQ18635.1 iron ABC transporter substrate-binding protein [Helicobacter pylori]OMQ19767.1 iron ABC transporter substrate-binding protein [Helicobacter pylori]
MLFARFKKALTSYSLGVLIVSSLLGVANASVQEVKVKDYFGEQTIKLPVSKIIYLGSFAEVPAMFNTWDRVVGISDYAFKDDIVKATLKDPERIKSMSSDHVAALNVELLKKLSPDLVVTFVGNPKAVEHAKKFGISFLSFQEKTIAEVMEDIDTQAKALEIDASKKLAKMQETLDFIKERLKGVKKKKGVELFHKANKISGHQALDSDILEKGGIDNFGLKYVKFGRADISVEKIVKENPEIIFIWWISPLTPEDVLNNPKFATIKAIKNKQVYKLPTMDIGGPRAPLISLYIALKAHPEAFKGVDINAMVKDYYKVVFDLNDAEIEPFLWH